VSKKDRQKTQRALTGFLESVGCDSSFVDAVSIQRAADLWHDVILRGQDQDLVKILGKGMPWKKHDPVLLSGLQLHLVCPHHLTVAFGSGDIAYFPDGRLASLGRLADLMKAATSRLVLQEEANGLVSEALMEALQVGAAVVRIQAHHPCCSLTRPQAHAAHLTTWSGVGDLQKQRLLKSLLRDSA
jgi:GTP cyclohydrolase I